MYVLIWSGLAYVCAFILGMCSQSHPECGRTFIWEEYLSIYPGTHVVILGICRYISMRSSWEWVGMYFDIHQKEGLLRTVTMKCSMSKGAANCRCSLSLPVVSVYCLL